MSVSGQNQTVVSKSAAKELTGLISYKGNRMIPRLLSAKGLNLDSFAADGGTIGFPRRLLEGWRGGSGFLLQARALFSGVPVAT